VTINTLSSSLKNCIRLLRFYYNPSPKLISITYSETVVLRTDAAKRFKKVENATTMLWKLLQVAKKNFRTLNSHPENGS